ncbi:MAG: CU044_2847 family protein [Candidatus Brachytrichaceae bacterium NZ_4S206]|jgi:hypothetical protein
MSTHTYHAGDGFSLLIETTAAEVRPEAPSREWGESRGAIGGFVQKAGVAALETAFEVIRHVAAEASDLLADLQQQPAHPPPTHLEVTFGVSFNGDLQAYIAKAGAEGTLSVKLSWETNRDQ